MRAHGRVVDVPESGPADHVCWVHDDKALAEVTSAHPLVRGPEGIPEVQVFHDADRVVVTGSVDTFTAPGLGRLLADSPAGPSTVLDLGPLEFVDVAGCRTLAQWAAGLGAPLRVTGASRLVRRMWLLLGLDAVAPVVFEESYA